MNDKLDFAEQLELNCIAGQKTLATLFQLPKAELYATLERILRGKHPAIAFFFSNQVNLCTVYRTTAETKEKVEPQEIRLTAYTEITVNFMGINFIAIDGETTAIVSFDRYFTL